MLKKRDNEHGPWCAASKDFVLDGETVIAPVRFTRKTLKLLLSVDGYEANAKNLMLKGQNDGTYIMLQEDMPRIDLLGNRRVQKILMAAYDLLHAVDDGNVDADVAVAAAELHDVLNEKQ